MTSVSDSSLPSKPQPQISKPPIKEGTTRYLYLFIHSFLLFYIHSFLPLRHCIVLQLEIVDWWLASITSITIQCRIFYYVHSWLLRTVRRRTLRSVARSVASARGGRGGMNPLILYTFLFLFTKHQAGVLFHSSKSHSIIDARTRIYMYVHVHWQYVVVALYKPSFTPSFNIKYIIRLETRLIPGLLVYTNCTVYMYIYNVCVYTYMYVLYTRGAYVLRSR